MKLEKNDSEEVFYDKNLLSKSVLSYEPQGAEISQPCLRTKDGEIVNQIVGGRRYALTCVVHFSKVCQGARFYALIRTPTGIELAGCVHPQLSVSGLDMEAGTRVNVIFEFACILNPGTYFCNFAVQAGDGSLYHRIVDAVVFRVSENRNTAATALVDLAFTPHLMESLNA